MEILIERQVRVVFKDDRPDAVYGPFCTDVGVNNMANETEKLSDVEETTIEQYDQQHTHEQI